MPMRDEAKDLIAGTAGGIAQVLVGQCVQSGSVHG